MLVPSSCTCRIRFVHRHPEIVLLSLSQKFSIVIGSIFSNVVKTLVYDLHCHGASKLSDKIYIRKRRLKQASRHSSATQTRLRLLTLKLFWEINKENKINKFENRDSISYPVWTTPCSQTSCSPATPLSVQGLPVCNCYLMFLLSLHFSYYRTYDQR